MGHFWVHDWSHLQRPHYQEGLGTHPLKISPLLGTGGLPPESTSHLGKPMSGFLLRSCTLLARETVPKELQHFLQRGAEGDTCPPSKLLAQATQPGLC